MTELPRGLYEQLVTSGLDERLRSYLGMLRSARNPGAVGYLKALPEWIDREPRAVGDYCVLLRRSPTNEEHWISIGSSTAP